MLNLAIIIYNFFIAYLQFLNIFTFVWLSCMAQRAREGNYIYQIIPDRYYYCITTFIIINQEKNNCRHLSCGAKGGRRKVVVNKKIGMHFYIPIRYHFANISNLLDGLLFNLILTPSNRYSACSSSNTLLIM